MVAPMWPTQAWFTRLLELWVDHPRLLQTSPLHFTSQANPLSPHGSSPLTSCVQALRVALEKHDIPDVSKDIILQSWRSSTLKQYGSYLRRWFIFCREGEDNPFSPHVNTVLRFLTHLYNSGLSYSAINSARSSISAISLNNDNISIGNNCFIRRFLRGVFACRPALPKYTVTWDTNKVLHLIGNGPQPHKWTDMQLAR